MNAPGCQHTDSVSYSTEKEQKTHTNLNLLKHKKHLTVSRAPSTYQNHKISIKFLSYNRVSVSHWMDASGSPRRLFYVGTKRDEKVQIEILKTAYC